MDAAGVVAILHVRWSGLMRYLLKLTYVCLNRLPIYPKPITPVYQKTWSQHIIACLQIGVELLRHA